MKLKSLRRAFKGGKTSASTPIPGSIEDVQESSASVNSRPRRVGKKDNDSVVSDISDHSVSDDDDDEDGQQQRRGSGYGMAIQKTIPEGSQGFDASSSSNNKPSSGRSGRPSVRKSTSTGKGGNNGRLRGERDSSKSPPPSPLIQQKRRMRSYSAGNNNHEDEDEQDDSNEPTAATAAAAAASSKSSMTATTKKKKPIKKKKIPPTTAATTTVNRNIRKGGGRGSAHSSSSAAMEESGNSLDFYAEFEGDGGPTRARPVTNTVRPPRKGSANSVNSSNAADNYSVPVASVRQPRNTSGSAPNSGGQKPKRKVASSSAPVSAESSADEFTPRNSRHSRSNRYPSDDHSLENSPIENHSGHSPVAGGGSRRDSKRSTRTDVENGGSGSGLNTSGHSKKGKGAVVAGRNRPIVDPDERGKRLNRTLDPEDTSRRRSRTVDGAEESESNNDVELSNSVRKARSIAMDPEGEHSARRQRRTMDIESGSMSSRRSIRTSDNNNSIPKESSSRRGNRTAGGSERDGSSRRGGRTGMEREGSSRGKQRTTDSELAYPAPEPFTTTTSGGVARGAGYGGVWGGIGDERETYESLRMDNEALLSETATLRRQLAEAHVHVEKLFEDQRIDRSQLSKATTELTQVKMDCKRVANEARDLQVDVEEYEEAITEKETLIQKLTEAVDCQLDKVDFLEAKLGRAEQEFVKMEDELKALEEENMHYREEAESMANTTTMARGEGGGNLPSNAISTASGHSFHTADSSVKDGTEEMQRRLLEDRERRLESRELEFQVHEEELQEMEQDVKDRERTLVAREKALQEKMHELDEKEQELAELELEFHEKEHDLLEQEVALREAREKLDGRDGKLDEWEGELLDMERRLQEQGDHQREILHDREFEIMEKAREQVRTEFSQNQSHQDDVSIELRGLADELDDLKDELERVQDEKRQVEQKLKDTQTEFAKLAEIAQEQGEDQVSDQEQILQLEEENAKLKGLEALRLQEESERARKESEIHERRDEELRKIQNGINGQLEELDEENQLLQEEIEVLKKEKQALLVKLQSSSSSGGGQEGESGEEILLHITSEAEFKKKEDAIYELQEEIAELRENIVEKEAAIAKQKQLSERQFSENEEIMQELDDMEKEFKQLEQQLAEEQERATSKLKRKDETIDFLQSELARVAKEKQAMQNSERQRNVKKAEKDLEKLHNSIGTSEFEDEAELQRIHGFNEQLRQLDDENRRLQEEFREWQESNSREMTDKDEQIQEVKSELAQLQRELDARKETEHAVSSKEKKDRKKDLTKARKALHESEDRAARAEAQLEELQSSKRELQEDVTRLMKAQNANDYVHSLKRQIKSLKDYAKAMEQKRKAEEKESANQLKRRDDAIIYMQKEISLLKQNLSDPATASGSTSVASAIPQDTPRPSIVETSASADTLPTYRRKTSITALWGKLSTPLGGAKQRVKVGGVGSTKRPSAQAATVDDDQTIGTTLGAEDSVGRPPARDLEPPVTPTYDD